MQTVQRISGHIHLMQENYPYESVCGLNMSAMPHRRYFSSAQITCPACVQENLRQAFGQRAGIKGWGYAEHQGDER